MSARPRATPWFGTLGERLEAAETEAREEHRQRVIDQATAIFCRREWDAVLVARTERAIARYVESWRAHNKWAAELLSA